MAAIFYLIYLPFNLYRASPVVVFSLGCIFGLIFVIHKKDGRRSVLALLAGLAWIAYGTYETNPISSIRGDLILICPVINIVTLLAVIVLIQDLCGKIRHRD
jgi:hypothetical protein